MSAIAVQEGARFTCQSCGKCCQGWAVPVDAATVERLRKHDWGADPFEAFSSTDEPYRTRLVDGRCFFLAADNRCRIHTEISYEAKPVACRAFPLAILDVAGRRTARLSFWCPTVVDNAGKPLEHQSKWLNETAKHSDHRETLPRINDTTEISAADFERVHQALRSFVRDRSVSIDDRLAAAAALIRRLEAATGTGVGDVVRAAQTEGPAALALEARRGGKASAGRRTLTLYLLQDRLEGRLKVATRLLSVLLFNLAGLRLYSKTIEASASRRGVRRVQFTVPAAGDELLTRYLLSKLDSRRYIAGEATLVTGFNLLLAAYGIINVLARMRAASHNRPVCDDEDIRQGVRAADLLVVEHLSHQRGKLHVQIARAALGNSSLAGDLLAALEG